MKVVFGIILVSIVQLAFSPVCSAQMPKYKVPSLFLSETLTIQISQPESMSDVNAYPALYVLNTNNFYTGDWQEDVRHQIRQLEDYQLIPQTLIVFVDMPLWYQTLFGRSEALTDYLMQELPVFVATHYQVSDNILLGHSYGAAYLINHSNRLSNHFDQITAISAVFPDVDYVFETSKKLMMAAKLNDSSGDNLDRQDNFDKAAPLLLIQEKNNLSDVDLITNKDAFELKILANHSHYSLVPEAIRYSLQRYFYDFVIPDYLSSKVLAASPDLGMKELKNMFINIRKKYHLSVTQQNTQRFMSSMANDQMAAGNLELAFQFWPEASDRFRHYFINQWGKRFKAKEQFTKARFTWTQLSNMYPESPFPWINLVMLAQQKQNRSEYQERSEYEYSSEYQDAVTGLKKVSSEFQETHHGMFLQYSREYGELFPDLTIKILQRITEQAASQQTQNSLADGLQTKDLQAKEQQTKNQQAALELLQEYYSAQGLTEQAKNAKQALLKLRSGQ